MTTHDSHKVNSVFLREKNERVRTNMSCFRHFILGFTFLFWVPLKSKGHSKQRMQKHFCCCCFCLFNFWVIIIQVYKHQREKQYVWRVHFERQSKGTHRTWRLQSKTQAWRRWQKMSFGDSTTSIGKSWWVSLLPGWWFLLLCWTAALGSMASGLYCSGGESSWGHGVSWPPFPNPAAPSMESLPK